MAGSRDVGMNRRPATTATMATGTLTRKTAPHQKCSSSQPPTIGPIATPAPVIAAHTPIALARSFGSVKTLVSSANVVGKMSAAPTPIAARAPISSAADPAWDATADAAANAAKPRASAPRRPYRSPRLPAASSSPASTRVYASTIHCSCALLACNCRDSVGRATLTIVPSTLMTKMLKQMVARAAPFRTVAPLAFEVAVVMRRP